MMSTMGRPKVRTDDVRDDVLRCALDALEQEGPLGVSARRVAASAGTSTAALYEFFGDKAGLVRAVFFEGFVALRAALDAVEPHDDARASLVRLLDASRRFALARPMLFELMYSRPFAEFAPSAADFEAATDVYRTIVAAVRRWLRAAGSAASATESAHIVVAAHRGFVMTELGGIAGSTPARREARYRRGVDAVLDGVLATAPAGSSASAARR
jgi:AcrR family transcriptional regulator